MQQIQSNISIHSNLYFGFIQMSSPAQNMSAVHVNKYVPVCLQPM